MGDIIGRLEGKNPPELHALSLEREGERGDLNNPLERVPSKGSLDQ